MTEPEVGAATAPENGQGAATTPEEGGTDSWLNTIPETETFLHKEEDGSEKPLPLREHPKLKEFKSPAEMAKSLLNAQQLLGKKTIGITPLKEDATDAEKAEWDKEFRRVMAVPEKPEDYQFKFAEGTQTDEGMLGWFQKAAHEVAMPPAMAQAVAERFANHSNEFWAEEFKKQEEAEAANLKSIEEHFGGVEKTAEAAELAKRGFESVAKRAGISDEDIAAFRKVHGNDKTFVRLFHQIGLASSKEDSQAGGSGGEQPNEETRKSKYEKDFPSS